MYKHYDLETIISRAEQGEAEFQYRLGRHHLVRTKNYHEAVKWFKFAADQGGVSALIDLGSLYLRDKYGVKDLDKAEQCFKQASELGGTEAMNKIGGAYYGVRNYNEAIKWFKAANNYKRLGDCYFLGHGFDKSYEEAFKCYLEAKDNNDIARCYFYGYGVEQNYEEAFKYYLAANDRDMLGECYLHGLGVERSVEKAIELWKQGLENDSVFMNYEIWSRTEKLAHLYNDGIDMEPNYVEAWNWWCELVREDDFEDGKWLGSVYAMYQIARYHYEGKGVKKSVKLALQYFKYAIDMFYQFGASYDEYDRERHILRHISYEIDSNRYISQEPDFIIHARKVLIEHGHKTIINRTKKAAQNGDEKAAEILNEFGIEYVSPKLPEVVASEVTNEPVVKENPECEPPVPVSIGDVLTHKTWGNGVVCEADEKYISVEFTSVGKKKFLNPRAFNDGFLKDAKLT